MARPLQHAIFVGFRLSDEMNRGFIKAAGALGISKSELVRALILQALRDEQVARAAVDAAGLNAPRLEYPRFISSAE